MSIIIPTKKKRILYSFIIILHLNLINDNSIKSYPQTLSTPMKNGQHQIADCLTNVHTRANSSSNYILNFYRISQIGLCTELRKKSRSPFPLFFCICYFVSLGVAKKQSKKNIYSNESSGNFLPCRKAKKGSQYSLYISGA